MMPTALIWCALAASVRYDVPADALLSVYSVERGGTDTWSHDANGTYDVGPLQFNTAYLASLRRFGITPRAVEGKTCYPWFLAAWRIHNQLVEDHGGFWTRVARYHSATPHYVATYRRQLLEYAPRWRAWLIAHYPTVVTAPGLPTGTAPTHAIPRHMPAAASRSETPPLVTRRRTTAPAGLQTLTGEGSPAHSSARPPRALNLYRSRITRALSHRLPIQPAFHH
jgi:hypothetical protein